MFIQLPVLVEEVEVVTFLLSLEGVISIQVAECCQVALGDKERCILGIYGVIDVDDLSRRIVAVILLHGVTAVLDSIFAIASTQLVRDIDLMSVVWNGVGIYTKWFP